MSHTVLGRTAAHDRGQRRRERLLETGERVFGRRGFDGCRMAEIAEEADCAVGTLYHWFESKEGLFRAVQARLCERALQRIEWTISAERLADCDSSQVVARFVEMMVRGYERDTGILLAIALRLRDEPALRPRMKELTYRATALLAERLEERDASVGHSDPDLAVAAVVQFVIGTLQNALINDPGPLHVGDAPLRRELTRMACAYLGMAEPESRATS